MNEHEEKQTEAATEAAAEHDAGASAFCAPFRLVSHAIGEVQNPPKEKE